MDDRTLEAFSFVIYSQSTVVSGVSFSIMVFPLYGEPVLLIFVLAIYYCIMLDISPTWWLGLEM
jgi:hypothetical protein